MIKSSFEQNQERCVVQTRRRFTGESCLVIPHYHANSTVCSICSAGARRPNAKFCAVCGHSLREGYAPLDSLKASYNLRKPLLKQNTFPPNQSEIRKLFDESRNNVASVAMAFMIYSLVPYLGILFCPGALVFGGIGLAVSFQNPQLGGRRSAAYSLLCGSVILAIQIMLWWLLYIIPQLNR